MIMILHVVVAEQFMPFFFVFVGIVGRFFGFAIDGIYAMGFFSSAVSTLKTVITAIGAGIGIWGMLMIHRHMSLCVLTGMRNVRIQSR